MVLISKPIHAMSQLVLDNVIRVPDSKAIANINSVRGFMCEG